MKKAIFQICFTACFMLMLHFDAHSQPRNLMFVGARPMGLGETYVAIADDGNAVYWNPAGLPTLKRFELNSMYANLFNIPGMRNAYLSLVYPLRPRYTIGMSYFHFGYDDEELEFFRDKTYISIGAKVFNNLFLGSNVKYLNTDARLDGRSEGRGSGFGFDIGALYTFPLKKVSFLKQLNLGLMVHDFSGTSIKYSGTNRSEIIAPQNIRFGLSLFAKEEISLKWFKVRDALLAVDFDDRFHIGTEAWFFKMLGLRVGLQKDFHTDESLTYSFGLSLKLPFISTQMDYAYLTPPMLASTNVFSFSFVTRLSPVKIIDASVNDIFASLYKTYATSHIGEITVRNDYDEKLLMTITISIPGLTETETHENFILAPNKQRTIDFSAVFSENILNVKASEYRQVKLKISYKIKNEDKFVETSEKFQLYGRGAITWDKPGKAAAFITKRDRMVDLFVLEATKNIPYKSEMQLGNIYKAAALFDAMGAIGIKYQRDPKNPFSMVSTSQHSVDHIKYPAELLMDKQGECDDLTVLYASLLECAGIKTALISTDEHITLMFDTGIHARNWGLLPLGDSLVVVRDKSLWIPVEVTEVGKSFAEAWEAGGGKYQEIKNDADFEVITVSEVEKVYLSALPQDLQEIPEEIKTQISEISDKKLFRKYVNNDFAWLQQRRTDSVSESYFAQLNQDSTNMSLRNKYGIILAQQDSISKAEDLFIQILNSDSKNYQALNNLANIYSISGEFSKAETNYLSAQKLVPDEPGLYLNLAILYQHRKIENPTDSLQFQQKSDEYLTHAFDLLQGDETRALDLLAITIDDIWITEKADFLDEVKKKTKEITKYLKKAAQKHLLNKKVAGARLKRKAVKRGEDKDRRYILWWAYTGGKS